MGEFRTRRSLRAQIAGAILLFAPAVAAAADAQPIVGPDIPEFIVSATFDPLYSTNAPFTTVPLDDFLFRALLKATVKGQVQQLFGYNFFVATRNDRFADLNRLNADQALAGFTFEKPIEGFTVRLVGTHVSIFDDYFSRRLISVFDFGGVVLRSIPLFVTDEGPWNLTPALKLIRRFSDVATSERAEAGASLGLAGPLWTGTLSLAAAYGFRPYDVAGRQDHNVVLSGSWTKKVNDNFSYSLVARYENNASNTALRSYEVFEIGPSITVTFSSK